MSKLRRTVLTVVVALALAALLFPPWEHTHQKGPTREDAGHSLILFPPAGGKWGKDQNATIDWPRLSVELLAVACIGLLGWLLTPEAPAE